MLKNWMIFILFILVILTNIWREQQVEITMERAEQRYEQAVTRDQERIDQLQTQLNYGVVKCSYYTAYRRGYHGWYCGLVGDVNAK